MRRLVLIRHARTSAVRRAAFPADEPLDERGLADAGALAGRFSGELWCSPTRRARQTCAAVAPGVAATEDERLAECDFGAWAGRTLAELHDADPAGVARWMTDPDAAPHGGESLRRFHARVGDWLADQARRDGPAVAITHGGVVKAAVVVALGAPIDAFWRLDVAPLRTTELHAHDRRWTVARVNA